MPIVVAPSLKVTVPVGAGVPEVPVTVAVKVKLVPTTVVAAEDASFVVVAVGGVTVRVPLTRFTL